MKNKNKLKLWILLLNLLLSAKFIAAQETGKIYVLTLNYEKHQFGDTLSFVDIHEARGSTLDYGTQHALGYKLDVVSIIDNQILKSMKFSVPPTEDNTLAYTIYIPYFTNGKLINIYDKDNNKILEIPLINKPVTEIEGEIEVFHSDDFEHPENSRFFFYLRTGTKRYELESDKQLPVILSGTPIKVKGRVLDNKILVEEFNIKSLEEETSQEAVSIPIDEKSPPEIRKKFNLNWVYLSAPILLIIGFLSYLEIKRIKSHKELMLTKQQQNRITLRNYVVNNLRKGYTKKQIRNALIKNNYTSQEIEEAFHVLR